MKLAAVLTVLALRIAAQDVVSLPVGTARPGASTQTSVGSADSQLHANVMTLMELSGDKERLQKNLPKLLRDGKAKMMHAFPNFDPAFADEWEKRMAARINIDDFLEIAARVYEKHFTNEEIVEIIQVVKARKESKPAAAPAQLQQKIVSEMPAIMGEIAGATTELGAKLGGQVGQEIEKEHPEYVRRKP